MFYLKEICYRLLYLFITFNCFFLIAFFYKEQLLLLVILSTIKATFFKKQVIFETSFIYTSPDQIININILLAMIFASIAIGPIIFLQIYNFIESALLEIEKKQIYFKLKFNFFLFYIINIIFIFIVLPNIWYYLEQFNNILILNSLLNIEYEPNLINFINFLITFLIFFNFFFIFSIVYFLLVHNLSLNYYLKNEKLLNLFFYFIFFMVFILFFEITFNLLIFIIYFFILSRLIKNVTIFIYFFNYKINKHFNNYVIKN